MRKTFWWHIKGEVATPYITQVVSATLSRLDELQLVPSEVSCSGSSSSQAIVFSGSRLAGLEGALNTLVRLEAFVDRASYVPLEGDLALALSPSDAHALCASGALDVRTAESGELSVALRHGSFDWRMNVALWEPSAIISSRSAHPPLKKSKLELIIILLMAGWTPVERLTGCHTIGVSELRYRDGIRQPRSYFSVLASVDMLVSKGVSLVRHNAPDNYYRCLMLLQGHRLDTFLEDESEHDDKWYRQRLGDAGVALAVEDGQAALDDGSKAGDGDDPDAMGPLVPEDVVFNGWTRVVAHNGPESRRVRVYFDRCTHQSGIQRGWVECPRHNCFHYVFVTGYDKIGFCSTQYQWLIDGDLVGIGSKADHLAHRPSAEAVTALRSTHVMEPF